jgi:hypothetical protein
MIRYTVEDIMREEPCSSYTLEYVRALWNGSETLSPAEIARLPIAVEDRIWALGRLLFRLSPHRARRVARLIALDVIELWDPPDIVVWFLGTGDEQAREAAEEAAGYACADARASRPSTVSAVAALAISDAAAAAWSASVFAPAAGYIPEASAHAAWSVASADFANGFEFARASAGDAPWVSSRDSARKRYLSWVVKAFDPFTPVGDLL